jgi:hypothetical protein
VTSTIRLEIKLNNYRKFKDPNENNILGTRIVNMLEGPFYYQNKCEVLGRLKNKTLGETNEY